ncbi:MAG: lipid-A-disaccharide synthase [Proteobacteria bacterium]|nr:lipid-A-disaccharide synthase [Pseudomonadota bacterium]
MKKGFIIAGEASADLYASNIVKNFTAKIDDVEFFAIGGNKLESAGAEILFNYKDISVVGAVEVISHLRKILKAITETVRWIRENNPDFIIFLDFPDFNFRVIKRIRKFYKGKIIYFISPQIWAWREKRALFLKKNVDEMFVILPFEREFYKKYDFDVRYLGHPLIDIVKPTMSKEEFRREFGFKDSSRIISIFPGSRKKEIEKHKTVLKDFIEKVKIKYADVEFAIVSPNEHITELIKNYFSGKRVKIIEGYNYDAIDNSFIVISKSGTTTLEIAILEKPAIVFYSISKISYFLAKLLVKVPYVSLPNLILNELVYPEFIQDNFTKDNLFVAFERFIDDTDLYIETIDKLKKLKNLLGGEKFFERLTEKIIGKVYG